MRRSVILFAVFLKRDRIVIDLNYSHFDSLPVPACVCAHLSYGDAHHTVLSGRLMRRDSATLAVRIGMKDEPWTKRNCNRAACVCLQSQVISTSCPVGP